MNRGVRRALIAAMCGALVLAFAGIASGKIKTKTFSSGDVDRSIPDAGSVSQDFSLTQKKFKRSKVKDVDVAVRITHPYVPAVEISITGPTGRTVDLSSDNGQPFQGDYGSGDESCGGTFTTFNDEAETAIVDGATPFNGQFTPEERLSTLDGTKVKGTWRLTVADDDAEVDNGVFNCAELKVKYKKKKKN